MINKITVIHSNTNNPYYNLALEEHLLETVEENECIMYLWQNKNTVVIGKNQNAWAQCNISLLNEEGGYLARRSSGGGAVYHDLGNLNFTFIAQNRNYDVQKQLDVIVTALKTLGIKAEKTGRNDITVDGKKISGNAFLNGGTASCHHGTLLVDSDLNVLAKYLNVSEKKLKAKGVDSVKARVVNIAAIMPDITVEKIKSELIGAFSAVYGADLSDMDTSRLNRERIAALKDKYASDEWRLGQNDKFEYMFEERFEWGEILVCMNVSSLKTVSCRVYSDALNVAFIQQTEQLLSNIEFSKEKMIAALEPLRKTDDKKAEDVILLLREQNI